MPTDRRIYRVAKAIHQRQNDLIIALDGVHDPHNISAVVRTADATGVGRVIWEPDVDKTGKLNTDVSKGSERWVTIDKVKEIVPELAKLKSEGYNIAVTHMAKEAVNYRNIDWTKPWVVVMGNEQCGCTAEVAKMADTNIFLPMMGFVQSLNISVAAAVILYEIQRQRENSGMYSMERSIDIVSKYFKEWKLDKEFFKIEDLLMNPKGEIPDSEFVHGDGRAIRRAPGERIV